MALLYSIRPGAFLSRVFNIKFFKKMLCMIYYTKRYQVGTLEFLDF